ncbi:Uma2 family endonuclease [Methyloprofundus sp.]|uniref:Uma2 family endonuclease n=1 Tax=Methyloprofundus sp. TaxID=2020875 RepID=UPI003D10FA76
MLAFREHYSLNDYNQWKGDWELVDGMAYAMSPSPSISHQIVAGNILTQLNNVIKNKLSGCPDCYVLMEVDWEISNDTVVRPDVLVICDEVNEKILKAPRVIFEVSSPSTARRDELLKFQLYEKEGVAYYVLVYPEKKIAKVYRWVSGYYQKQGDFDKGDFEFDLGECSVVLDLSTIWRN